MFFEEDSSKLSNFVCNFLSPTVVLIVVLLFIEGTGMCSMSHPLIDSWEDFRSFLFGLKFPIVKSFPKIKQKTGFQHIALDTSCLNYFLFSPY